jgi:hypothetical protein
VELQHNFIQIFNVFKNFLIYGNTSESAIQQQEKTGWDGY